MLPFYKNALLGKPPVVFGERLKPFSVIHAAILEAIESPLVMPDAEPALDDLLLAVWLCRHDYPNVITALERPGMRVKWWAFWLGLKNMFRWHCGQLITFNDYLSAYSEAPERWKKPGDKKAGPRVPWTFALHHRLTGGKYDDKSVADAWNTPVNVAIAYCAAIADANGDESLVSEEEKAAAQALREQQN